MRRTSAGAEPGRDALLNGREVRVEHLDVVDARVRGRQHAEQAAGGEIELRLGDERPLALHADDLAVVLEHLERLADDDPADVEHPAQLPFGRKRITDAEPSRGDLLVEDLLELVVERDAAATVEPVLDDAECGVRLGRSAALAHVGHRDNHLTSCPDISTNLTGCP